ncbi:hypothetical protein FNV43_RR03913 [Rhamnella rubrinervis]|uniref:AT hook motif-containing protein n=1 Tax=Rhamnella rubrinervis TaxID=2594499 RepID=A0A8K0MPR4_9ROSA|nr:hypothetical protein FNV43_RR03913 [Rhamnella rubrinervis]
MNQTGPGNDPDASTNIPVKRKRGRPRKYPRLNIEESAHIHKNRNLNWGRSPALPPGFAGINGNQPRQVAATNVTTDVMVGKAVSGVVEAVFDAGYLLSVRVEDSATTLRGVVFKPGRYVPVSAENDVASDVQMIRRNEIPIPVENYTRVHGYNPLLRERNEQKLNSHRDRTRSLQETPTTHQVPRVAPHSANHVASKENQGHSIAAQTGHPEISTSNVVSAVLQPANGLPIASQPIALATEASHLAASKGKQGQVAAEPSKGLFSTGQVTTDGKQPLLSQPQTNHQPISEGMKNENGSCNQPSTKVLFDTEVKSKRFPGMSFEKLLTEVIKGVEASSQSAETQSDCKPAGKMASQDCDHGLEDEDNNVDQPLAIEPLQAVEPDVHNDSISASKPMEDNRTSKMSELLQVR